jgi:hypothetical protein
VIAVVDLKERYRRQASVCYEIAATMSGERAISMLRLGDTYAALASDPDRLLPNDFSSPRKYVDPVCKKCGQKMQWAHSLPSTDTVPATQAFRCGACNETLIWKGEAPSTQRSRWITRYFVLSFRRVDGAFVPGPAVECPDADLAIQRAELMTRDKEIAGGVVFARCGNPETEEYNTAVILKTFGEIPPGFDIG